MSERSQGSDQKAPQESGLASKTMIGAVWLVGWRMCSRAAGLISTLILARVLVPSDFGIVAMANTFAALVDALSQIGVQDALVRRQDDDRRIFDTAFTMQAGRALATGAVLALFAPAASWWFNEPRLVPMLLVLAGTVIISGAENVGTSDFRRNMNYRMVFWYLTVPRLTSIAVAITAALILRSYWALLIGGTTLALVRTTMSYVIHSYRPRFSTAGWRKLASFSLWIWAASIAQVLWERIDLFVIGPLFGKALLGLYVVSWELASLPCTEIVVPVSDALFAGFSRAQKDATNSAHHAPLVAAMLVSIIAPIAIAISCASGYVVAALLGPHWASARILVSIMAWLSLFAPLSSVCNAALVANGSAKRGFMGKAAATALKAAVLVVASAFSKRIEIVAAAMTVCMALESCGYLFLLGGLPGVRLRTMVGPIARILAAGSLSVLLVYQLGIGWNAVTLPSFPAAICGGLIGIFVISVYAVFLSALWFISGRPVGPEIRLFGLIADFLRPVKTMWAGG